MQTTGNYHEAQRHYRNACKLDSTSGQSITGLLIARFSEQGQPNNNAHNSAELDKIYEEIDQLEKLNQPNGLSEVSAFR